jgi:hypothetical protein
MRDIEVGGSSSETLAAIQRSAEAIRRMDAAPLDR